MYLKIIFMSFYINKLLRLVYSFGLITHCSNNHANQLFYNTDSNYNDYKNNIIKINLPQHYDMDPIYLSNQECDDYQIFKYFSDSKNICNEVIAPQPDCNYIELMQKFTDSYLKLNDNNKMLEDRKQILRKYFMQILHVIVTERGRTYFDKSADNESDIQTYNTWKRLDTFLDTHCPAKDIFLNKTDVQANRMCRKFIEILEPKKKKKSKKYQ